MSDAFENSVPKSRRLKDDHASHAVTHLNCRSLHTKKLKHNLNYECTITVTLYRKDMHVEDQYTTRTILKPSGWFFKRLAGFKTGWPDLIHYIHPRPL